MNEHRFTYFPKLTLEFHPCFCKQKARSLFRSEKVGSWWEFWNCVPWENLRIIFVKISLSKLLSPFRNVLSYKGIWRHCISQILKSQPSYYNESNDTSFIKMSTTPSTKHIHLMYVQNHWIGYNNEYYTGLHWLSHNFPFCFVVIKWNALLLLEQWKQKWNKTLLNGKFVIYG